MQKTTGGTQKGKNVLWKLYQGKQITDFERRNVDRVKIRSLFWKALLGEISPEEMEKKFNNRSLPFSHLIRIPLHPLNIIHVLEKFLQNEIDEWFIKQWALFILMMDCYGQPNDEYCNEHYLDHASEDKYEAMWHVVQQLSAPEIDGELTPEKAVEHINFLQEGTWGRVLTLYNRKICFFVYWFNRLFLFLKRVIFVALYFDRK